MKYSIQVLVLYFNIVSSTLLELAQSAALFSRRLEGEKLLGQQGERGKPARKMQWLKIAPFFRGKHQILANLG